MERREIELGVIAIRVHCPECRGFGTSGTTDTNGEPTDCHGCNGSGVKRAPEKLARLAAKTLFDHGILADPCVVGQPSSLYGIPLGSGRGS